MRSEVKEVSTFSNNLVVRHSRGTSTEFPTKYQSGVAVLTVFAVEVERLISRGALAVSALLLLKPVMLILFGTASSMSCCSEKTCAATL